MTATGAVPPADAESCKGASAACQSVSALALRSILAWLDRWQEKTGSGPAWPYWVARDQLRHGQFTPSTPRRPSWYYGTTGLAWAQQLAALARGDVTRQIEAENALAAALTDPAQLQVTTDNGLCHGIAGLAHIAARAAADARPATVGQLRATIPALLAILCPTRHRLHRRRHGGDGHRGEGVASLIALADAAAKEADQGQASAVYNQAALLASDIGLPDLARDMCHQQPPPTSTPAPCQP